VVSVVAEVFDLIDADETELLFVLAFLLEVSLLVILVALDVRRAPPKADGRYPSVLLEEESALPFCLRDLLQALLLLQDPLLDLQRPSEPLLHLRPAI